MSITKEEVLAEAKKLGLTLSDAQVDAHVLIGALPKKAEDTGSHTEDDDDDQGDDGKGLTDGARKRIEKLNKQKKEALARAEAAEKLAADAKKAQEEADRKKSADKGEWEKLQKTADEKAKAADDAIAKAKQRTKEGAVKRAIETGLLAAGLPSKLLDKALKLFPAEKVEFGWTKEDDFEYEIEDFGSVVDEFKKDNDFLWAGAGDSGDADSAGFRGREQPTGGKKTASEKKREELRKKHPQLFS